MNDRAAAWIKYEFNKEPLWTQKQMCAALLIVASMKWPKSAAEFKALYDRKFGGVFCA